MRIKMVKTVTEIYDVTDDAFYEVKDEITGVSKLRLKKNIIESLVNNEGFYSAFAGQCRYLPTSFDGYATIEDMNENTIAEWHF